MGLERLTGLTGSTRPIGPRRFVWPIFLLHRAHRAPMADHVVLVGLLVVIGLMGLIGAAGRSGLGLIGLISLCTRANNVCRIIRAANCTLHTNIFLHAVYVRMYVNTQMYIRRCIAQACAPACTHIYSPLAVCVCSHALVHLHAHAFSACFFLFVRAERPNLRWRERKDTAVARRTGVPLVGLGLGSILLGRP